MKKIKFFFQKLWEKGLIYIFVGTFLTKLISFFGSVFLVRVLSKQEYGVLSYLENYYGYLFVFAGMGSSNAILRYVILANTVQEKYDCFYYNLRRGLKCNILLIILGIIIGLVYPHPAIYKNYSWLIYILLFTLPFQYMVDNILCNERALFENKKYVLISIFLSFSIIFSKVIAGNVFGIIGVIFIQIIVYCFLSFFLMKFTIKNHYYSFKIKDISDDLKKEMGIYSLQYMITNGLWAIFMLNDTFLLGRFCSPEVIAEYKVAYTIPGSITLISTAIGVFVVPYFVKNEKNKSWIRQNFKRTYIATTILVGIICLMILILSKPIIIILYGQQYLGAVKIMKLLLISAFLNCGLRYTIANILAAIGKIKYNMLISILGVLLQLSINIWVVPKYNAIGVAATSCLVYAFMAFSLFIIFYFIILPKLEESS